jgi:hypothetical protein
MYHVKMFFFMLLKNRAISTEKKLKPGACIINFFFIFFGHVEFLSVVSLRLYYWRSLFAGLDDYVSLKVAMLHN